MTYRIQGLARESFLPLFAMDAAELAARGALRVTADSDAGYPCRISLEDARIGESLILLNFASHDVPTPFRTTYAIYVRETAGEPPCFVDGMPPYLERRTLGLRAFDEAGMLRAATLAMPGEADSAVRELLGRPEVASVHAHNAAHGCFLALIERN